MGHFEIENASHTSPCYPPQSMPSTIEVVDAVDAEVDDLPKPRKGVTLSVSEESACQYIARIQTPARALTLALALTLTLTRT